MTEKEISVIKVLVKLQTGISIEKVTKCVNFDWKTPPEVTFDKHCSKVSSKRVFVYTLKNQWGHSCHVHPCVIACKNHIHDFEPPEWIEL